jgi:IclR family KDG regulon transcriptional repressor
MIKAYERNHLLTMPYQVSSVDTALSLLEVIAQQPGSGVTEIAQRSGNTKSQVFRLLYTLEQRGYVRKDPATRTYTLGYRALYLGERGREQIDLVRLAQPLIEELSTRCMENVYLIAREGLNSVCIALKEAPQQLRLYAQVGRKGPLHAGGGSKVLLAYAPQDVRQAVLKSPLETFTSSTITDPSALEVVLNKIRQDGYHLALSDLDEGAYSLSAPIRDYSGAVVAALSIAGPAFRLDDEKETAYRTLLMDYSQKISQLLGWLPAHVYS